MCRQELDKLLDSTKYEAEVETMRQNNEINNHLEHEIEKENKVRAMKQWITDDVINKMKER